MNYFFSLVLGFWDLQWHELASKSSLKINFYITNCICAEVIPWVKVLIFYLCTCCYMKLINCRSY